MNTNQLTFTRFVAALFIVLYHFAGELFPIDNEFIQVFREHLYLGVDYFYVLSGFVMILAYGNKDSVNFSDYMKNRIARIYPLHFFTLFLTILISIILSINYLKYFDFNSSAFLAQLFLFQAWIPSYSLTFNVPSWSVSVEMFFYICFPFLFNLFIKKNRIRIVIFGFLIFWLFSQIFMNIYYFSDSYGGYNSLDRYFLFYNPFFHLNSFCIGLMFGVLFINYKKFWNQNYDLAIITVFILTSIFVYLFNDFMVHNGFFAIPFGLLIFLVAGNKGRLTELFQKKTLIHLGEISFALYLLQNPVFIFLRKIFKVLKIDAPYLFFFLGLALLLVASHLTYVYIEKPMRKRIRNISFMNTTLPK